MNDYHQALDSVRIKERPILFSAPMVRAIRDGRKTQTRRALAPADHTLVADILNLCQFGRAGDRLWVREAWAVHKNFDGLPGSAIGVNAPEVWYCSDYDDARPAPFGRYRHGRFMPRWACRLVLEVVTVRVERLQAISEADAMAEGVDAISLADAPRQATWNRRADYKQLWDSLNADRGYGWEENPWVWVIEFKRAA